MHIPDSNDLCCAKAFYHEKGISKEYKEYVPYQIAKKMHGKGNIQHRRSKAQTNALGAFKILYLSKVLSLCLKAPKAVTKTIRNATLPQTFQKKSSVLAVLTMPERFMP